jgi:hypothetical protein
MKNWLTWLALAAAALDLGGGAARAGSATSTLSVTIQAPLVVAATPPSPTIACLAPPGTVVSALSVSGGDGNPVTFTATGGDTTDFAVAGANVVVAAGGIVSADCGKVNTLQITATQP